ncbi:protein kinase family protein [Clostridium botulinum]|uniref:protein kinase family protein n=1 Tax=Clostridium botulinum TaxID=1491 RepID=UPI0004711347|nr:protein kinase family protein [Clostridium botulinum]APC81057.1 kinase domain protein [Clostridium botulinum]KEI87433.1 protein kinase [Clostridium botulinum B2 267]MBY6795538.1 protein kinase family protein [Clostridium botulinum]MBY6799968.1 protein kinase family protein [Clostridium botulinum]MBY6865530.1 protein kinase family protein [Clostridium botulinum]
MVIKFFKRDTKYLPEQKIHEYTVLKVLGEGRFGICYLVQSNNKQYILKQLKTKMLKKIGSKVIYEQEILKNINHNCIPKFVKTLQFERFFGYVLEYKEGKTFEEIICEDEYVFKREEIYDICIQIIEILKYLHKSGIVHRDIRIPNTIYYKKKVNLVDFGLARWINNKRYTENVDFSYLGDFLLHLYYTSFQCKTFKGKPWYEELDLFSEEMNFLKRLLGIEKKYKNIEEVERDFLLLKSNYNK